MNPTTLQHPQPEELAAFVSGQAPEEIATGISQHLSECEACRTLADALPADTLLSLLREGAEPVRAETNTEARARRDTSKAVTIAPAPGAPGLELPAELADNPRYRVLELLGSGGMGAVYKAEHRRMERHVALKVMSAGLMTKPAMVERFQREVKAAARLTHANIVTAYDADQVGGAHFLVMEFVEGLSLAQHVQQRARLPIAQACDYIRQAALGLQHAFERGMVHRDIKPHNLMLTPGGQVKILDFGLARFVRETAADKEPAVSPAEAHEPAAAGLTEVGMLMGTADFIAPEQANDPRRADIRADIYSLGCTLYYLLAGRVPFPEGTSLDKLRAHADKTPVPLGKLRGEIPAELTRVVEKMMAKDPAKRYQTPAEAAGALARFTRKPSLLRRFRGPLVAAGLLASLVAAAVIYVQTDNGEFVIETDDPTVAVMLHAEGLKIHDRAGKREYLLKPGKHNLRTGEYQIDVSEFPDGFELTTTTFKIRRGGQEKVSVRYTRIGSRKYLADGLRWFPADSTFFAARDMRVFSRLSLQQIVVLTQMAENFTANDRERFWKLVNIIGDIERVSFAYVGNDKQPAKSKMFLRLTGAIKHNRIADWLRQEWPAAVLDVRKDKDGEPITIASSSKPVAPAFAVIGKTDLLLAAYQGVAEKHLEVVEQALALRAGGANLAGSGTVASADVPKDAWAFFAGRPPEALKSLIWFPELPQSVLLTISGRREARFHFQGKFTTPADAASFAKNLASIKQLGLFFLKSPPISTFKAAEPLAKILKELEVNVDGARLRGGYNIPGTIMDSVADLVEDLPLSVFKKLGDKGSGAPGRAATDPDVIRKFGPSDKPIGLDWVPFTPEHGGWRIEPFPLCTIPLFEIANPGVEDCVVKYRARLKTVQDRVHRAYLEMLCRFPGKGEAFSRGLFNPVSGTDWADYEIPFFLDKGQRPDLIKLNLVIEGPTFSLTGPLGPLGPFWIKDVEVRRAPLPLVSPFTMPAGKRVKAFRPTDKTLTTDRVVRDGDGWRIDSRENEFRTIHLFEVPNPGVDGCLLIYRLQIKTRLLGSAYQEMWVRFPKATADAPIEGEFFSKGFDRIVSGNTDWTTYLIHFRLERNQRPDLVKLDLVVGGLGRVWVKNVELVQAPLVP